MKMMINRIFSMPLWIKYVKILQQWHFFGNNIHTLTTGDLKLFLKMLMLKKRQKLNWKVRLELEVRSLKKVNLMITRIRIRMSSVRIKLSSYWMC